MTFWEWFGLAVIIVWIPRTIYRMTQLQRAMRSDGLSTKVNLMPLWYLLTFRRQWRKAQWEYIREQKEHRDGNQRLREDGDGRVYVSDGLDYLRLSGPKDG